jgi:phytoene dehydrogenase-like protein
MTNPAKVAVIGAGISGLACAYRLQQFGLEVPVFESNSAAGGMIEPIRVRRDTFCCTAASEKFRCRRRRCWLPHF